MRILKKLVAFFPILVLTVALTACVYNWQGGPVTVSGGAVIYAVNNPLKTSSSCGTVPHTVTATPKQWGAADQKDANAPKPTQANNALSMGFSPGDLGIGKVPSGYNKHVMKWDLHGTCNGAEDTVWIMRSGTNY